jgi:hypothetical protein
MAATPHTLTSELRKKLFPVLTRHAFAPIKPRIAYRSTADSTCILSFRCVGAYFSKSTGFPSQSMMVTAGMYYPGIPNPFGFPAELDKDGLPNSMEVMLPLEGDVSRQPRRGLRNAAEEVRKDIWWIQPDGSNLGEAIGDIAIAVEQQALPWFGQWDTLASALESSLAAARLYPGRTWRTYCLAKRLGRTDVVEAYRPRLEKEWPQTFRLVA